MPLNKIRSKVTFVCAYQSGTTMERAQRYFAEISTPHPCIDLFFFLFLHSFFLCTFVFFFNVLKRNEQLLILMILF